jgi:hypothetical protein
VKKLSKVVRAGRDVGKVLQRYLFTLTTYNEKFQYGSNSYRNLLPLPSQTTAFIKLWRYPCPPDSPNFFTASGGLGGLKIFLKIPSGHRLSMKGMEK